MTTDALTRWLISQVTSGNCVLFLGAGASRGCIDSQYRHGPTAAELAQELGEHFLGKYNGWSLPLTCSYAISATSRPEVDAFIRDRLLGLQPSPGILALPQLPWKSIYTTN